MPTTVKVDITEIDATKIANDIMALVNSCIVLPPYIFHFHPTTSFDIAALSVHLSIRGATWISLSLAIAI